MNGHPVPVDVIRSSIHLKHSSVETRLEVPKGFDPKIGFLVMVFPGLGAPGEVYEEDQHYIAQKTGNAVLTMTWGRGFDWFYLTNVRKEHSHQAVAAAEQADRTLQAVTRKILFCHSNGGGDGAEEAVYSLSKGRGAGVVGLDFEASVGNPGWGVGRAKDTLAAAKQTLAAVRNARGQKMARASAQFCAANPPLLVAESIAAVTADITPHMGIMNTRRITYVNNVYTGDAVVPPNFAAPNVRINDGNHYTPMEPEVAHGNVVDLMSRIEEQTALVQWEHARAS